jgi:hypothetical protein
MRTLPCSPAAPPQEESKRDWPDVRGYFDEHVVQRGYMLTSPVWVKHFQAIHHSSVDVAHGLALLFGLGTRALPSWDSKTRWNNLLRDLAVEVTADSSGHTNSPHPSSREGHHSTVGWISGFLLFELILCSSHAAATSLVHRKSVPSTHMRCMITANRRVSATIAFFIPRCLAIFIAQALSQDHFVERTSMIWAAS